jgi:hypothetical protein
VAVACRQCTLLKIAAPHEIRDAAADDSRSEEVQQKLIRSYAKVIRTCFTNNGYAYDVLTKTNMKPIPSPPVNQAVRTQQQLVSSFHTLSMDGKLQEALAVAQELRTTYSDEALTRSVIGLCDRAPKHRVAQHVQLHHMDQLYLRLSPSPKP